MQPCIITSTETGQQTWAGSCTCRFASKEEAEAHAVEIGKLIINSILEKVGDYASA
jgi:hypothetical protein